MAGYRYMTEERQAIAEALNRYIDELEKELKVCEDSEKNNIRAKIGFASSARLKIGNIEEVA